MGDGALVVDDDDGEEGHGGDCKGRGEECKKMGGVEAGMRDVIWDRLLRYRPCRGEGRRSCW
jgi:hypothetical protein